MKRKMITLFLTTVAFVVLTPSIFARPAYSVTVYYYQDSYPSPLNPNYPVGESLYGCTGFPYHEGEITDTSVAWFQPCPWTFEEFPSCEEVTLLNTNCANYCVTNSYWMSVVVMHSFADPFGCL